MKRILIVDDDAIVRTSLKTILEAKKYRVIGTGKNGIEAIELFSKLSPDIVLMDIRMAGKSGLDATREILEMDKNAKILLITTFQDEEYIEEAIKLGCRGYILKENISGLEAAIEAIVNDNIVFDSKVMGKIAGGKEKINEKNKTAPDSSGDSTILEREISNEKSYDNGFIDYELSSREKDVLKLISEGLNNKEMAESLFLSEGTVRNYISSLLSKLNLRDRTQLAIFYYKNKN